MLTGTWRAAPLALAHFYEDGAERSLCKRYDDFGADESTDETQRCRHCERSLASHNKQAESVFVRKLINTGEGRSALVYRLFAEAREAVDARGIKRSKAHAKNMAAGRNCHCAHCVETRRHVAHELDGLNWSQLQIARAIGLRDHASVNYLLGRTARAKAQILKRAEAESNA